jgi:hypothetical protein
MAFGMKPILSLKTKSNTKRKSFASTWQYPSFGKIGGRRPASLFETRPRPQPNRVSKEVRSTLSATYHKLTPQAKREVVALRREVRRLREQVRPSTIGARVASEAISFGARQAPKVVAASREAAARVAERTGQELSKLRSQLAEIRSERLRREAEARTEKESETTGT